MVNSFMFFFYVGLQPNKNHKHLKNVHYCRCCCECATCILNILYFVAGKNSTLKKDVEAIQNEYFYFLLLFKGTSKNYVNDFLQHYFSIMFELFCHVQTGPIENRKKKTKFYLHAAFNIKHSVYLHFYAFLKPK